MSAKGEVMSIMLHVIKGLMLFLMLTLVGCGSSSIQNDTVSYGDLYFEVKEDTAYVSGVLDRNLVAQLSAFIAEHPNVNDLVLVDIHGSFDQQATMAGARLIRRLGLNTHIAQTGFVLSGGVDLFLGGVKRTIGAGAGVGVHAWSDGTKIKAANIHNEDPVHAVYVNFYLEMGIPARFYWFSLDAALDDRVYFLSPEEVYDFQLVTQ